MPKLLRFRLKFMTPKGGLRKEHCFHRWHRPCHEGRLLVLNGSNIEHVWTCNIYIIEYIHCWCNFTKHELEGTLVLVCADVARCFCQVGIESRQRWVWLLLHKSLFDRSHDANICQQIRHFGNIQQKECFLQFRMLQGWRTHIYFSTLNTASGNKGCHTHSLQLLRLPCFFERDVCWAEFDRKSVRYLK